MSILDKARKRLANINEKKSEFNNEFWKPHIVKEDDDPGDRIRMICPPYLDKADAEPWVESATYTFPLSKDKQYYTHAPSKFGLEDIVQEYRKELYQRGDEESKKKARTLGARDTYFALVVDLNEPEKGVQIWTFGNKIMEVLCNKLLDDDYNIFWNLEDGHDIKIKRTGEKMEDTKYAVDLAPKPSSLMDSIKRVLKDDFDKFKLTQEDIIEQASKIDLAVFVKVDTTESLEELLTRKLPDDFENVFKKRREERDAVHGRPLPLFIERENALTKDDVENRRRVEEEDAEFEDPFLAPSSKPAAEEKPKAAAASKSDDDPIGKTFAFVDQETDDEGDPIGEATRIEGECTAARIDEELGMCYVLDCGEHGKYEVPVSECELVAKKKPVRKFKKPEKTAKQSSVLDQVKQIKEEAEDE